MIPIHEDEIKQPLVAAPVPADPQAAEGTPTAQAATPQAANKRIPEAKQQAAGITEQPKAQGSQSIRVNQTMIGGPGQWSQRLGTMGEGTPYLDRISEIDSRLPQALDIYRQTGRNPLADIVLVKQKPTRNVDEESRLRHNAKLQALNNMLSLIGQGVAATGGLRPAPVDNRSIYDIQNRLQRLDDIYRQEGLRYDQNTLMAALRKDQANQNAAKQAIDTLSTQRKHYMDMYKDAEDRRQKSVFKGAELDAAAQKLQVEAALKTAGLAETVRHNRAGESLGWAKHKAANPKTLIRDYRTGKYVELTPEIQADLSGVIAQAINQRESAKKNGGNTYMFGNGSDLASLPGSDGNGKRPLPLNNYFTDEEIKAFQKSGKFSVFSQASLSRLYNDLQGGDFYDPTEAPGWIPALPDPKTYYTPSQKAEYMNGVSETLAGLMQSDIFNGGDGKFTPEIIRDNLGSQIANLSDNELNQVITEAEAKFKK